MRRHSRLRRAWNEVRPAFSVFSRQGERVVGQVGDDRATDHLRRRAGARGGDSEPGGGAGLAPQRVVAAADDRRDAGTRRRGVRFGLLFCVPEMEGFYARLGWRRIDRVVTMATRQADRSR